MKNLEELHKIRKEKRKNLKIKLLMQKLKKREEKINGNSKNYY